MFRAWSGRPELQETLGELRQAQRDARLLEQLLDQLPIGVSLQDAEGCMRLVNGPMAEVLGVPAERLLGRRPFDLLAATPAQAERMHADYLAQFASGEQRVQEYTLARSPHARTLSMTSHRIHCGTVPMMLSTAVDITDRRQMERDLSRRAFHDELTGLPNRLLMQEIVGAALRQHRRGGHFALAFIDLDNFKQVNDYYSPLVGDELLKAVARRIGQCIRTGDTLARISGDEFLLLADPLAQASDLPPLIERLIAALKQPFHIDGQEVLTSASVGASLYPLHGDSYEELRRCAGSAMVRAKRDRKGSAAYFDEAMGRALSDRMLTERRLRAAVRDRRFRAAFQPKVAIGTGEVRGFEALIRWVEDDGTVRAPASFIELASELGLLDEIARFAAEDVVRHLPSLQARFGPHVTVSLNVSARQAGDTAFMGLLTDQLRACGVAQHIVIELTEDALLATQRFQQETLPRLREAGIRVSIDDFGTGYSSLSMLADLTADEVKVDRAFITAIHERPRSQGILRAIESLCSALGIEVVAEGVETAQELAYLRSHTGIGVAQGYLFAKPQFIEALLAAPPPACG
ncbi:EAL domain-containing protein [Aquincola sp. MAHUQ-54]|uniref:EAL domain-containing protein n=1 Tax=Aquincola agrisoli TaxID=3119538 RepID=A0AAW9QDZ6_9BURK